MNTVREKIAFLKGLKAGLGLKDEATEKLMTAVIDVLDEVSDRLDEHEEELDLLCEDVDELSDELEELDEELGDIDDVLCDILDEDDDEDDDWDDEDEDKDEVDGFFEDDDIIGVVCRNCGEDVCVDVDVFRKGEEIRCPECDNVLFGFESAE